VLLAVNNVNTVIASAVAGRDTHDQVDIDRMLRDIDGSEDKSILGANAILGVSLAVARAAAAASGLPLWKYLCPDDAYLLPMPMVNMISGGLHARGNLDFQDFLIVPVGAQSFSEALEMVLAVYSALGNVLAEQGYSTLKADEGGYGPALPSNYHAMEAVVAGIERAGYRPGDQVAIALDVAATHFFDPESARYNLATENQTRTGEELIELLGSWARDYPLVSIEDGLAEDDWEGWQAMTGKLGDSIQLIGDDLITTNPDRLRQAIDTHAANAVLVKMNQIGTLTETRQVIEMAQNAGLRAVISGRSGETEDSSMADLAVATSAGQIKVGSVAQSERLAKYNQLLRIEEALGPKARFAGKEALGRR
jgi:enolase